MKAKQVKKLRAELEEAAARLMYDFNKKTGLRVTKIEYISDTYYQSGLEAGITIHEPRAKATVEL